MQVMADNVQIHPTAIVDPLAQIGTNCKIGAYSIIEQGAVIGDNTTVDRYTTIEKGTHIGKNCRIFSHTILGGAPQSLKYKGEKTRLTIGDNSIIREFVTISRGTPEGGANTQIGSNCFIMAYAHIAHDCKLGDYVVLANAATLAGHVRVYEHAIIGGITPVHQFVRIGAYAMVGGASGVGKDIVPYAIASGNRAKIYGLNIIGLKRHKFSSDTIKKLNSAYKLLFYSQLNTAQALEKIEDQIKDCQPVDNLVGFIKESTRGICKKIDED